MIDLFAMTAQHSLCIYLNNTCNPEISKVLIFGDLVLPKWDQSKLVCVQSEQSESTRPCEMESEVSEFNLVFQTKMYLLL